MSTAGKLRRLTMLAVISIAAGCDASAPNDLQTEATPIASNGAQAGTVVAMARGEVDAAGGLIHIVAPSGGRLTEIRVVAGDNVMPNETLATLDSRAALLALDRARLEVAAAQARVALAQSRRVQAERQRSRVQEAQDADAASPQALDEARESLAIINADLADAQTAVKIAHLQVRAAEANLDLKIVRAPIAGRIVEQSLAARASQPVQEGAELFLLAPPGPRVVRAQVEEAFADNVRAGMRAEILVDSNPQRRYPAQVIRVGDVLRERTPDPASNEPRDVRRLDCVLSVTAPELRIGQRVLVRFLRTS
jgi:multidrug resistance efflux pump